LLCKGRT
jgi:tetratricopeptide (TPR) repeat protein